MTRRTASYSDDDGEMDTLGARVLADFLPPPERLRLHEDDVEVTLALSRQSFELLKQEARRRHVSYRKVIRTLIESLAERQA